ncbi:hypothetical protein [Amycolatopsis sp. NPDC059657]|uniref:hypothetical protein n=1 Tax=Amycolatopsis sp. NPDC059657 TaxID=3346899 RepID=UPI00366EE506
MSVSDLMLRRRYKKMARALIDIDPTRDPIDSFVAELSSTLDREVKLLPTQFGVTRACGVLISDDPRKTYYICYPSDAKRLLAAQVVFHEGAHALLGHDDDFRGNEDFSKVDSAEFDALRKLLPDIDPEAIRRRLARTEYDAPQETAAETLASYMTAQMSGPGAALRRHRGSDNDVLSSLFDIPQPH